eukprot:scaffold867_cov317-Pavlova_lutheri.AAC.45
MAGHVEKLRRSVRCSTSLCSIFHQVQRVSSTAYVHPCRSAASEVREHDFFDLPIPLFLVGESHQHVSRLDISMGVWRFVVVQVLQRLCHLQEGLHCFEGFPSSSQFLQRSIFVERKEHQCFFRRRIRSSFHRSYVPVDEPKHVWRTCEGFPGLDLQLYVFQLLFGLQEHAFQRQLPLGGTWCVFCGYAHVRRGAFAHRFPQHQHPFPDPHALSMHVVFRGRPHVPPRGETPRHRLLRFFPSAKHRDEMDAIRDGDGVGTLCLDANRTMVALVVGNAPDLCRWRRPDPWRIHAPAVEGDPWRGRRNESD